MEKDESHASHAQKVVKSGGQVRKKPFVRQLLSIAMADDWEGSMKAFGHRCKMLAKTTAVDLFATFVLGHPVVGNNNYQQVGDILRPQSGNIPYYLFGGNTNSSTQLQSLNASVGRPSKFTGTVMFSSWQDASDVLQELNRILDGYKRVRLLELYDAAEIDGAESVSNNWGWTSLEGAQIYPYGNGWILQLPPVSVLN